MSEVRVVNAELETEDGHASLKLVVGMVPGSFPKGREVSADHIHPAIREHLAKWAGQSSNAEAMGILEALQNECDPEGLVYRHLTRALELLR